MLLAVVKLGFILSAIAWTIADDVPFVRKRKNGHKPMDNENFRTGLANKLRLATTNSKVPFYFTQKVDHFDNNNLKTWKQRYYVNDQFFNGTGPVFLFVMGEATAEEQIWDLTDSYMAEQAKIYGALIVSLEHRFYGKTIPAKDLSTVNLNKYLHVDQALADLAAFRNFIYTNKNFSDQNKWVAFGGSYPGQLAAYLRQKYPHLIYAAVASSAPMKFALSYPEYLEVVNSALSKISPTCPAQIQAATNAIYEMLKTKVGKKDLKKKFKLCESLTSALDISNFFNTLSLSFGNAIQYYGIVAESESADYYCKIMTNETIGSPFDRYVYLQASVISPKGKCQSISYKKGINDLKKFKFNSNSPGSDRQWTFQVCTQLGLYINSDSTNQPFGSGFSETFNEKKCFEIFGNTVATKFQSLDMLDMQTDYGGSDYKQSRVIFVNGDMDPWNKAGVLYDPYPGSYSILINGTAHCRDMYSEQVDDSQELKDAKTQISSILSGWLSS